MPKQPPRTREGAELVHDGGGLVDFEAMSAVDLRKLQTIPKDSRYWLKLADHLQPEIRDQMVEALPRVSLADQLRLREQICASQPENGSHSRIPSFLFFAAAGMGLLVALFGLAFSFTVWREAPDVVWVVGVFGAAALVVSRDSWSVAAVLATIAGAYGESLVRLTTGAGTALHLQWLAAATVWFALLSPTMALSRSSRRVATAAGCVALAFWVIPSTAQSSDLWILSMATPAIWVTQMIFAAGLFKDPRVLIAACGAIPFLSTLVASLLRLPVPEYGSTYILASNFLFSLGPLTCVLFALAPEGLRQRFSRETAEPASPTTRGEPAFFENGSGPGTN